MKKTIMGSVVMLVMMVMGSIAVSAYNGDPTATFNSYNNNYGYCTGMRTDWNNNDLTPSNWFNVYREQHGVRFGVNPTSPIIRNDVFAPVGKAMDAAYEEAGRSFSKTYGVRFNDYTWNSSLNEIAGGLYQRDIMVGYPEDNTVRFGQMITRGEMAKVVCIFAEANGFKTTYTLNFQFDDMNNHWASIYASKCHALGIMLGVSDYQFAPDEYVTYEQFVTIMLRIAEQASSSSYSVDYEDVYFGISDTMNIDFQGYDNHNYDSNIEICGNKTVRVNVGDYVTLKVRSDDRLHDGDVDWDLSNSKLRNRRDSVKDSRYATAEFYAVTEGTTTVTASYENSSVRFTVIIEDDDYEEDVYVSSIKVNPTQIEMEIGESQSITANVYPSSASNKGLVWKSHNTSIATVTQSGNITAVGVGNTTVTVTAKDGSDVVATIDVTVTAEEIASEIVPNDTVAPVVELTGSGNVEKGNTITLTAKIYDENIENVNITAADVVGINNVLSVQSIKKTSNDSYQIVLQAGYEVGSVGVRINAGVATDTAGNTSDVSSEAFVFVTTAE